jgi:arylsulfatase A-like enzyme
MIKMNKLSMMLVVLLVNTPIVLANKQQSNAQKQPNIVVFLVDDMGLMDTSVPFITNEKKQAVPSPLNDWYHTPNMEALANKGTRFTQFYAQSVCSPTRASLLTGQNAARHQTTTWIKPTENNHGEFGPKKWNWQGLAKSSTTLPAVLKNSGYKTIHIGKGHFGPLASEGADPANIGFDVNIAGGPWGRPKSYFGRDQYGNHDKYKQKNELLTHNIPHLQAYYDKDIFLTEALTLEANKQITAAVSAQKPFFLYMSHYAVHAPFDSDPRFAERYQDKGQSADAQAYATLIEGMDTSLGDIVKKLTQLNIAENTLIFFLGDNGGDAPFGHHDAIASSAPLKGKKGTSWEGGMRAPLIVAWAKPKKSSVIQQQLAIVPNNINSQLTSVLDIYPTLLSAASATNPASHIIDGVNLTKQLSGQVNNQRDNSFLMHFPHQHRHSYFTVYRFEDWKVIYHYDPKGEGEVKRYQLYNLLDDPSELTDLAATEPKKLAKMMELMISELKRNKAQYPIDQSGRALKPIMPKVAL